MKYTINVPDMHCERCVERIKRALNDTGIKFEVDLENRFVTAYGCEHCLKIVLSELEDLGFSPMV